MTATPAQLIAPLFLPASATLLYASPAGTTTQIDKATLANGSAAPRRVSFSLVLLPNAPDAQALLVPRRTVFAGQTLDLPDLAGIEMPPGWGLFGLCDLADAVVIGMWGTRFT